MPRAPLDRLAILADRLDAAGAADPCGSVDGEDREFLEDALADGALKAIAGRDGDDEATRAELRARLSFAVPREVARHLGGPPPAEPYEASLPWLHDLGQLLDERLHAWGLGDRRRTRTRLEAPAGAAPLEAYERGVIAPLDERVAARWTDASRRGTPEPPEAAEVVTAISTFADDVRRRAGGFVTESASADPGAPDAPGDALEALGRSLHRRFVREQVSPAWARWGDPALEAAAGSLFRRLAINPRWTAEYGIRAGAARADALLTAELLAPRRAWAYVAGVRHFERDDDDRVADESWRRAVGRPPYDRERRRMRDWPPPDLSALRGIAYGTLLEESLLARHGRRWYGEPAAWSRLLELWDGERDASAERMAEQAGVGTIDASPLVERALEALDPAARRRLENA